MATNLLTPILNDLTRSVNFFNGRLLTGDDLTTEQKASRATRALLGQAVGDGVAFGLEVTASSAARVLAPVVSVKQGLALNRNGLTLFLSKDIDIGLVRPANNGSVNTSAIFQDCAPVQSGPFITGAGVYVLTIGPAAGTQGLAEVSGIGSAQAPCNSKYNTDGVQFRLLPIDLSLAELDDVKHLRNLVAYKCFDPGGWTSFVTDPFAVPAAASGLMDQLRSSQLLTDCEVPLATLFWTATGGLIFVDNWSVRRPIFQRGSLNSLTPLTSYRRAAEGMAMFLQFQSQVSDIMQFGVGATPVISVAAADYFRYLPPAGLLPLAGTATSSAFTYPQFLGGHVYRDPVFIEGSKVDQLFVRSWLYPPIDLNGPEMVWLYSVRENAESIIEKTSTTGSYVIFSNGQIPFQGIAAFDLNYWDYANFV